MNPTISSCSDAILRELSAWCEFARNAVRSALIATEPDDVRVLKLHLLQQHEAHLAELHDRIAADRIDHGGAINHPPRTWAEVVTAMSARDPYVAVSACVLLERAVLAAYERAANRFGLDPKLRNLVRRHQVELRNRYDQNLRLQSARSRRTARPIEPATPVEEAVAVAS